jgi:hypothetical protein
MPNQYDNNNSEIKDLVVRLETELDNMIKMFAWSREALEKEMLSGLTPGKHGIPDALPKKLKELTIGMSSLVECKIRYDKAKKELAKNMTPQEEMDAVFAYIMNLSPEEKNRLRDRLSERGIYKWKS